MPHLKDVATTRDEKKTCFPREDCQHLPQPPPFQASLYIFMWTYSLYIFYVDIFYNEKHLYIKHKFLDLKNVHTSYSFSIVINVCKLR